MLPEVAVNSTICIQQKREKKKKKLSLILWEEYGNEREIWQMDGYVYVYISICKDDGRTLWPDFLWDFSFLIFV